MKKLAFALTFVTFGSISYASDFDGVNFQIGMGGSATTTNVTGFEGMNSNGQYDYRNTQGSFNGMVLLGYSKEVPNAGGLNLAMNVFYVIGDQKAGNGGKSSTWNEGSNIMSESSSSSRKLQNTFGITFEPGLNFSKTSLGYLKLAWLNSRQNMVNSYTLTDPSMGINQEVLAEFNQTRVVNGFGYGLGFKQLITENIYAALDVFGVSYSTPSYGGSRESIKSQPSQVMGFASIGYKF